MNMESGRIKEDINIFSILDILYTHKFKLIFSIIVLPLLLIILNVGKPSEYLLEIEIKIEGFSGSINKINGLYPNINREIDLIDETINGVKDELNIEKTLIDYNEEQLSFNSSLQKIENNLHIRYPNLDSAKPYYLLNFSFNEENKYQKDFLLSLIQNSYNNILVSLYSNLEEYINNEYKLFSLNNEFNKREMKIKLEELKNEYILFEKKLNYIKINDINKIKENILIAKENNISEPQFFDLEFVNDIQGPSLLKLDNIPLYFYGFNILNSKLEVLTNENSSLNNHSTLIDLKLKIENIENVLNDDDLNLAKIELERELSNYYEKLDAIESIEKDSLTALNINPYNISIIDIPKYDIKILLFLAVFGFLLCSFQILFVTLRSRS